MTRLPLFAAAVVTAALTLAACGDSSDGGDRTQQIVDLFVANGSPEDEARCVADELDEEITAAEIDEFVSSIQAGDEPPELGDPGADVALAVGVAVNACGL